MSRKRVFTRVFAAVLALLGATQALAQFGPTLLAKIPFEFSAGTSKLPSGEYSISPAVGLAQPMLSLRSEEKGSASFLMTISAYSVARADQSKLVFHKYGDQYFLAQVWVEGETRGWQVPASRSEREVSQRAANYSAVTVLARR